MRPCPRRLALVCSTVLLLIALFLTVVDLGQILRNELVLGGVGVVLLLLLRVALTERGRLIELFFFELPRIKDVTN